MDGWLLFGCALLRGRKKFKSDEQFGRWMRESQLAIDVLPDDRAAAMWAAEDINRFRDTKKAHPRVRTIRGLHAKHKELGKAPKVAEAKNVMRDAFDRCTSISKN